MTLPIIGDLIREGAGVLRELVPDADKRMEIEVRLSELADQADKRETELLLAQTEVNKIEASSSNFFVAGWRPFVGWSSGAAFAYSAIVAPIAKALFGLSELPSIPMDQIYPVLMAMLGVGAMRTYEKVKGVAGGTLGNPPREVPPEKKKKKTFNLDWLK